MTAPMSSGTRSVMRIERINLAIGTALSIGALVLGNREQFLGVVTGVALTCINFMMLRRLVFRWTTDVAAGRPTNRVALVAPKMLGLMAAVVFAITFLPISIVGFTIGYSVFVGSIILDSIYLAIWPTPADPSDAGADAASEDPDHG
jgi:hypothetical protein